MQNLMNILSKYSPFLPEWRTIREMGNIVSDEFKKQGYTGSITRLKEDMKIRVTAKKDSRSLLAIIAPNQSNEYIEVRIIERINDGSTTSGLRTILDQNSSYLPQRKISPQMQTEISDILKPKDHLGEEVGRIIDEARLKGGEAYQRSGHGNTARIMVYYGSDNLCGMPVVFAEDISITYYGDGKNKKPIFSINKEGLIITKPKQW